MCACHNQLQPHDPIDGVCPEPMTVEQRRASDTFLKMIEDGDIMFIGSIGEFLDVMEAPRG